VSASSDRKTAVVTGGTDGIGKEIGRGLARQGFDLVIVGRDAANGEGAARDLRHSSHNPAVAFVQADLALMRDVTRLADLLGGRWPALHYLVHDAGVVLGRRKLTPEGIEANFAINYLSRFVLTRQLLPLLAAGSRPDRAARIVVVSGAAASISTTSTSPPISPCCAPSCSLAAPTICSRSSSRAACPWRRPVRVRPSPASRSASSRPISDADFQDG
jgi:NAD(P)-dependent dehydrogenase (short-subunit alcohol dehydrogenase family)